jgi:hypothetical protein
MQINFNFVFLTSFPSENDIMIKKKNKRMSLDAPSIILILFINKIESIKLFLFINFRMKINFSEILKIKGCFILFL